MVTGATSGIGRACALKFSKAGYRVIVTGRRADALAELSAELADAGAESLVLVFDVRDRKSWPRMSVRSLPQDWKEIGIAR